MFDLLAEHNRTHIGDPDGGDLMRHCSMDDG